MLKQAFCSLSLFLVALSAQASDATDAASRLAAALQQVHSVSFYFVSRTGNYSLPAERLKASATVKVHRDCGNNCRKFMDAVISHLGQATLAKCLPGQQNALIEMEGEGAILYSYSGRMIEFEEKCYFNSRSINGTVKSTKFLFD